MVWPGTGSHSPYFQSLTMPRGLASWPGVSCSIGTATRSLRTPRCLAPRTDSSLARAWKMSKSVRDCHGGGMAGEKELINGCMSVEDRSYFSYQVAAGMTTSANTVVEVMR